jgi:hypothetical protein
MVPEVVIGSGHLSRAAASALRRKILTLDPTDRRNHKEIQAMNVKDAKARQMAPLGTPTNLTSNGTQDISGALTTLLADMFALSLKTKNFHWHMSGQHFRDYHLLLDEQSEQIFAATDAIAERVRKIGGTTIRSIGQISRLQQRRRLRYSAGHVGRTARLQQAAGRTYA